MGKLPIDRLTAPLFKNLTFRFSTGKPFDPTDQIRTDPIKDMIKKEEERENEKRIK